MKRLPAATSEFVNLTNLHRKHSLSGCACCETLFSWSWEVKTWWETMRLPMVHSHRHNGHTMVTPFPKDRCVRHPVIPALYPSSLMQNSKCAPYEVKSQWNFQDQKCFNVTTVLKSNRSTPNPLPLLHPYLDFSSHFLRFAGKLFELLRHNGKTLLLPLCFGRTHSETVNSKDVLTIGLWSSKFIEALDMPNSWGIPMKGSEQVNGRDAYQKCCKGL